MLFYENYELCDHGTLGEAFIGANTSDGFCGMLDTLIDESKMKRVYVIKGAAGTGKSTLLKRIYGTAINEGVNAVRYACSSDPHSLDLVVLNSEIAILDGTAPHSYDMQYPGTASSIVDLSVFWDIKYLEKHKDEIVDLTQKKKSCYANAYSNLRVMYMLFSERMKRINGIVDSVKLEKYVLKLVRDLTGGEERGSFTCEYHRCISTSGRFRLDTLEKKADRIIKIIDHYGSAYIMTRMIADRLSQNDTRHIRSVDPLYGTMISEIYLPKEKTLVTIEDRENAYKYVNMKRFINSEDLHGLKGEMRLSKKCSDTIDGEVLRYLNDAGDYHRKLEIIYREAMDFAGLNEYNERLCNELLGNLK